MYISVLRAASTSRPTSPDKKDQVSLLLRIRFSLPSTRQIIGRHAWADAIILNLFKSYKQTFMSLWCLLAAYPAMQLDAVLFGGEHVAPNHTEVVINTVEMNIPQADMRRILKDVKAHASEKHEYV